MEVILLEHVEGLGERGAHVQVASGYARNFLLPKRLALPATSAGARTFAAEEHVRQSRAEQERKQAEALAHRLGSVSITIPAQVGEEEKLFGSVTAADIADALQGQGFTIDRRQVQLEEPLRVLGVYKVDIRLSADMVVPVKVWITKQ